MMLKTSGLQMFTGMVLRDVEHSTSRNKHCETQALYSLRSAELEIAYFNWQIMGEITF